MTDEGERIAKIERDLYHLNKDFETLTSRIWKLGWFIAGGLLAPWIKFFAAAVNLL